MCKRSVVREREEKFAMLLTKKDEDAEVDADVELSVAVVFNSSSNARWSSSSTWL